MESLWMLAFLERASPELRRKRAISAEIETSSYGKELGLRAREGSGETIASPIPCVLDSRSAEGRPALPLNPMSATVDVPQVESSPPPDVEEQLALVERIVASAHFRRSARLRDFLLYVAGQYRRDPHAELNEQEIGEKVFGRPSSYDRSQDNIVRVNATELRRRIELYFAEEGAAETLLLEIPRGGYKPVFRRRIASSVPAEPAAQPIHPAPPTTVPAESSRQSGRIAQIAWPALCAVLAIACIVLWRQDRSARPGDAAAHATPALTAFWGAFAGNHQTTDVVLSDDSASVIQDITHRSISMDSYLNHDYMQQIQASDLSTDRKLDLSQISEHNLVTFGVVRASQLVLAQLPSSPPPHLTMARYYTADAIKRDNVILLGGQKANPWDHLFDDRLNFVVGFDHKAGHAIVTNVHPKEGELASYSSPWSPNALTGYSVVAYLPSPSREGHVIILAGVDSDSTGAAAEFLTSEDQMERFRELLKVKEFPYFEVLLRNSRVSGTSFSEEIVAYRTYPRF